MKLTTKIVITLSVVSLLFTSAISQVADPKYNQKSPFPDNYQSATNSTNLDASNYTSPMLSHVLFEENPKGKLTKYEFVNQIT